VGATDQVDGAAGGEQGLVQVPARLLPGAQDDRVDFQDGALTVDGEVQSGIVDTVVTHPRDHGDPAMSELGAVDPAGGPAEAGAEPGAARAAGRAPVPGGGAVAEHVAVAEDPGVVAAGDVGEARAAAGGAGELGVPRHVVGGDAGVQAYVHGQFGEPGAEVAQ